MTWVDLPVAEMKDEAPAIAAPAVSVPRETELLKSLERKRDGCARKLADLQQSRENLSWKAHAGGGRADRAQLSKLHQEIAAITSEQESFRAAIVAQQARISAARVFEADRERRAAAEEAVSISSEMFDQAQLCGECVTALVARVRRFQELADQAHRRGFGASPALIAANLRRALGNSLHALGLGDLVPVSQRAEPGSLLANYAARVAEDARRELGESEAA
jgi:hypothetical protein